MNLASDWLGVGVIREEVPLSWAGYWITWERTFNYYSTSNMFDNNIPWIINYTRSELAHCCRTLWTAGPCSPVMCTVGLVEATGEERRTGSVPYKYSNWIHTLVVGVYFIYLRVNIALSLLVPIWILGRMCLMCPFSLPREWVRAPYMNFELLREEMTIARQCKKWRITTVSIQQHFTMRYYDSNWYNNTLYCLSMAPKSE